MDKTKLKIYESPDKGKTVYEREFGSTQRTLIKTSVQQQWNISYTCDINDQNGNSHFTKE